MVVLFSGDYKSLQYRLQTSLVPYLSQRYRDEEYLISLRDQIKEE